MARELVIGPGVVEWVETNINRNCSFSSLAQGIGLRDGRMLAGVVYDDFNGVNVFCHICSDGSRRWMTREYLRTIFDYPFNQMKARRITVVVAEGNRPSRRFVEHLGFSLEARLLSAHPSGDLLVYAQFKEACPWIRQDFYRPLLRAA